MAIDVKIPSMGESITSGILSAWLVKDGEYVSRDQPIYELETDKITSEATAEVSGIINFKVEQDTEVEIGSIVATIDEKKPKQNLGQTIEKKELTSEKKTQPCEIDGAKIPIEQKEEKTLPSKITPLARKIAEKEGINLDNITGTGNRGKITKSDLQVTTALPKEHTKDDPQKLKSRANDLSNENDNPREEKIRFTPIRKKIAQHLVKATQQTALLTTFNEVDMTKVISLRKKYQKSFVEKYGIKLGFMSFFTKAVVSALKAVPQVNARIEGDFIIKQHFYDIGIAVGTDKGLMVPVVKDCDKKGFHEIESKIAEYASNANKGKIELADLEGGVFTISNGGIYGSMLSTPIINFPQAAILGLHNIKERAVVIDGEILAKPMMYLALSYDHRLIDGKEAVTFLNNIKESIENPDRILIGL